MFLVVIGGLRVIAHIKAGKAPHPLFEIVLARVHESMQVEGRQALAVVHPVKHHWKFPVVHAIAAEGHLDRAGLGILPQVAFPGQSAHAHEFVGPAQHVQHRPVDQIFNRIVRSVVAPPTRDALQVAALVEIVVEKRLAGAVLIAD